MHHKSFFQLQNQSYLVANINFFFFYYYRSLSSIGDLGSWDDVRVRYTYYKEHGYLRDLTLQDYIKWEQWWYKYQDWLDNERYYDR